MRRRADVVPLEPVPQDESGAPIPFQRARLAKSAEMERSCGSQPDQGAESAPRVLDRFEAAIVNAIREAELVTQDRTAGSGTTSPGRRSK